MTKSQSNMKFLYDRRDELRREFEAARARLDEVEGLIRRMSGEPTPAEQTPARKPRRGGLKEIILELYEEAGEAGLSTTECIQAAKEKRGVLLQPASVSSTLSRFKADDVLRYDGERYRLKKFAGPRSAAG